MKTSSIFSILFLIIILATSVLALGTGTDLYPDTYSCTGNWSPTHNYTLAFDTNQTTYGECLSECDCIIQYLTPPTPYSDVITWIWNSSTLSIGSDLTGSPCIISTSTPLNISIHWNATDAFNITYKCWDHGMNEWETIDAATYDTTKWTYDRLYWLDVEPTIDVSVAMSALNGTTKTCSGVGAYGDRIADILFSAEDNTDNELSCMIVMNGAESTTYTNSSISNNTASVFSDVLIPEGTNTLKVRCYDESSYGDSDEIIIIGEACQTCSSDLAPDVLVFGVLILIILWFGASLLGNIAFFKDNWWIIMALIAVMYILWWLTNWAAAC